MSRTYRSVLDAIQDPIKRFVARGSYYLHESVFENGHIYNARIDMHNKQIQNVGTPTANGDAVPYGLFAAVTSEFEPFNLTSTTVVTYANSPSFGTYFVNVRSQDEGGPTACWCLSRANTDTMSYTKNLISSANGDDGTRLEIAWPPNSPLMIWKSSDAFDGLYEIKVSR